MDCVKEFLNDSYQYKLRLMAQGKSERYEDTLINYKKIFIAHLNLVKKGCANACINEIACNEFRNVINSIDNVEIESFFEKIREIYLLWIDGRISNALENFTQFLIEYDLLKYEKDIEDFDIFFKARVSQNILTSWDMFHIPFNKRYLIGNQRYSLTGQPMLYIGSSVIDVVEEIGAQGIDDLKLSVIILPKNELKIYDLRCNTNNIIDDIWIDYLLDDEFSYTYNKADFFKMILSSICSFLKQQELKGFTFCEEYVIPQMLAQILKIKGFDGIAYYSTKRYNHVTYSSKNDTKIDFKENIAIFTKLNSNHVYDRDLYELLTISVPIDINKIDQICLEDLEEIKDEINASCKQEKITCAEKIVSSFKRNYDKMYIHGKKYTETDYGKLHLYEVYTRLSQILVSEEV